MRGRNQRSRVFRATKVAMLAWVASVGAGSACAPPGPPIDVAPALALDVELTARRSCGVNPVAYRTDCLAAVAVVVRSTSEPAASIVSCRAVAPDVRPPNLFAWLTSGPSLLAAAHALPPPLVIEVRGLHDRSATGEDDAGPADPCANPRALDDPDGWLLWGDSAPFDPSDVDGDGGPLQRQAVEIRLECRDCADGCASVGTPVCPSRFPESYCTPADARRTCARACTEACFDGALACTDGVCDVEQAPVGGFCAACDTEADCGAGRVCLQSEAGSFCADPCPAAACPRGSRCNRVGNGIIKR